LEGTVAFARADVRRVQSLPLRRQGISGIWDEAAQDAENAHLDGWTAVAGRRNRAINAIARLREWILIGQKSLLRELVKWRHILGDVSFSCT